MKLRHLVYRELAHRKLTTLLALLAIATVCAYSVSSIVRQRYQKQKTERDVAAMDDDIRKITKAMGFNIHILPADQNLQELYADDFANKTMPYEYVQKLADSRLVNSLNHLRPALFQRIQWREKQRPVILFGISGVIPWTHRKNAEQPLSQPVPVGAINVGHALATDYGVQPGQTVILNGESFTVHSVMPAKGNKDDITIWMDLAKAQQMLNLPGEINLIQALECNCASPDRLAEIETDISRVLGSSVQVIELSTTAIARAQSRTQVAKRGEERLAQMRRRSEIDLLLLAPTGAVIVGVLAWLNARDRRAEIGILSALGATTQRILTLFVAKAIVLGVIGAVLGCLVGILIAGLLESGPSEAMSPSIIWVPGLFATLILLTPVITTMASWIPAMLAARQDVAGVLAES